MPRVLVTGSAGFVGSAFVRRLLQQRTSDSLEVRTFDLEPTRVPGCQVLQGNTLDPDAVARAVSGCDMVVHLAAYLGVRLSDQNRVECLDVNIAGTRNVLDACAANGVQKVVFVSSSEVYGDNGASPVSETSPLRPKSVYAVSKLAGEEYVQAYAARHGFDHTILRLFNAFGPEQREDFVIPRFAKAAVERRPPRVFGTGRQVRAFCSVEDIAEGMALALYSPLASGEVFNLGNEAGAISIFELGQKVVDLSRCGGSDPELVPYEQADRPAEREVTWRVPDLEKASRLLHYAARVSLDEGILRVLDGAGAFASAPSA